MGYGRRAFWSLRNYEDGKGFKTLAYTTLHDIIPEDCSRCINSQQYKKDLLPLEEARQQAMIAALLPGTCKLNANCITLRSCWSPNTQNMFTPAAVKTDIIIRCEITSETQNKCANFQLKMVETQNENAEKINYPVN